VVGIGEDGVAGLGDRAKQTLRNAEHVFGGERHLGLASALIRGHAQAWPKPFDGALAAVRALRGKSVAVLASGDPFLWGVGATLARHIPATEMLVLPAPSAFSLAAAKLGWALAEVNCVSLHGRPVSRLRPCLRPGRRVLALTSDGNGPAEVAALLVRHGFGASRVTVLEALGGPRERVSSQTADGDWSQAFDPLNLVAVEVAGGGFALPLTPGLPDETFRHDGQITKSAVRALTLSALAPRPGELLWDVGAGSGSVAVEWMLGDPSLWAIAIEARADRAENIRANAEALGVPGLQVVEGRAPEALRDLPAPDAVFVGGGGSGEGAMPAVMEALKPGGRLVANAVTLEMEAVLLDLQARHGGHLLRLALSAAEPVGGMTGWRPAMPVTQWAWVKP
jgi:precorrin-6Y C5,15-methyltransferase (decarboxylating)